MIFKSHDDCGVCDLIIEANQWANLPKPWYIPLRHTDALVEPFSDLLFLPVCLFLSYLLYRFLSHSISQCFFHMSPCLPPSPCPSTGRPLSAARVAILCHLVSFLLHFHPVCPPFSLLQSNPFTLFPQIPSATPAFSPSFSICLSPSLCLLFPLPPSLFCSPAAHKNSSFLSPEDCSVAQGFTAFFYAFSPSFSPYLSPLASLRFGSTTQRLIQPISSFVLLTHLYPS